MDELEHIHLKQLKAGSESSFRILYDFYHPRIYHFCLRFLYQEELSKEATADVFIQLWKKRSIINDQDTVGPLLYKIAKDISFNYLKKIANSQRLKQEYIEYYLMAREDEEENDVLQKEAWNTLLSHIELLPPKRKEILNLRYKEGLDYKTIGQKLNISPNTVKVQLVRARKFLKYKKDS